MTNYWAVNVSGTGQLIARMRRFDADAYKILSDELKQAGNMVAEAARSEMPDPVLSNWGPWTVRRARGGGVYTRDLAYNAGRARSRIKPVIRTPRRKGEARQFSVAVQQMDAAGAIFMLAGSRNKSRHQFNLNVNLKYGAGSRKSGFWPRVLTPALYAKSTEAFAAIEAAIERAVQRVNNG